MKKINIITFIEVFVYYLMMFSILFLRWYKNIPLANYIILFSTIILIVINIKRIKYSKASLILILLSIIYIYINILFTENHQYLKQDLIVCTVLPFFTVIYFYIVHNNEVDFKKYILNPSFIILNVYNIINFLIIIKQVTTPYYMVHNFCNNSFYADLVTGLMGCNATHKLMYFYIIILYINVYFFDDKSKLKKVLSKGFFIFTLITSLYASTFNDNRMYYFILVIFMLPIIIIKLKKNNKEKNRKILKRIIIGIIICLSALFLYSTNKKINTFINEEIINKYINRTFNNLSKTYENNTTGEERAQLFFYTLKHKSVYTIGEGIGCIMMYGDPTMPKHYGLNEFSARLYMGGFIFLILIISTYSSFYYDMIQKKKRKNLIFIVLTLTLLGAHNQAYTNSESTFFISMIYYLYTLIINKYSNQKEVDGGSNNE